MVVVAFTMCEMLRRLLVFVCSGSVLGSTNKNKCTNHCGQNRHILFYEGINDPKLLCGLCCLLQMES